MHLTIFCTLIFSKSLMFSNKLIDMRNYLRQCVADTLPGIPSDDIYNKIKGLNINLTQQDLIPFCKAAHVPVDQLPNLLSPYGITENRISRKNWKLFFEDQFCTSFPFLPIPQTLSNNQIEVLTKFTNSIRSRTEESLASQWIFVASHNPTGSNPAKIRLSAFCRIVAELDLVFKQEELIDSVISFFGHKISEIDFVQFAQFMQTFH